MGSFNRASSCDIGLVFPLSPIKFGFMLVVGVEFPPRRTILTLADRFTESLALPEASFFSILGRTAGYEILPADTKGDLEVLNAGAFSMLADAMIAVFRSAQSACFIDFDDLTEDLLRILDVGEGGRS